VSPNRTAMLVISAIIVGVLLFGSLVFGPPDHPRLACCLATAAFIGLLYVAAHGTKDTP
jgi:hypothetical protein